MMLKENDNEGDQEIKKWRKYADFVIKPYNLKFKALPKLKDYKIRSIKLSSEARRMSMDLYAKLKLQYELRR